MAISTGTVFSSIPAAISEKKSSLNNARHEGYTIADIADAVSADQLADAAHMAAIESSVTTAQDAVFKPEELSTTTLVGAGGGNLPIQPTADVFVLALAGPDGSCNINLPSAGPSQGRIITIIACIIISTPIFSQKVSKKLLLTQI